MNCLSAPLRRRALNCRSFPALALAPVKGLPNYRGRGISTQELDATKGDRERIVILGSGWSGFTLSRQLNPKKYQVVVISPRSYFVFTPLLASTAVGTLEFRNTLESVRSKTSDVKFYQGWADDVNFAEKFISVEENAIERPKTPEEGRGKLNEKKKVKGKVFDVRYDKLVVAVGCYSQTFGTRGVRENALFLKDIRDARKIRTRVLECFETAALPTTSDELRKQLLNFAIVGGGPTGVEFAAELFDLCHEDLQRMYPSLLPFVKITIYDVAAKILPMFDKNLADYALEHFRRDGIAIKTEHHIQSLVKGLPGIKQGEEAGGCTLTTKEDGEVGVGMCVWSTGLMMNPFIEKALSDVHRYPGGSAILSGEGEGKEKPEDRHWILKRHEKTGGLIVDSHFRVKLVSSPHPPPSTKSTHQSLDSTSVAASPAPSSNSAEATMRDVFALGDVTVMEKARLPATAQVANQEAKWLGKMLNKGEAGEGEGFTFRNMGVMTYLGGMKAIMQTGGEGEIKGLVDLERCISDANDQLEEQTFDTDVLGDKLGVWTGHF
ncbi:hypothetical protein CJF32_00008020 [Rutstroemia sp. NJR-2017a WRK4]|nr:hypothetical protein CJF32_00008020 [Rutstroemia sp. NJR-2017a WRK4]